MLLTFTNVFDLQAFLCNIGTRIHQVAIGAQIARLLPRALQSHECQRVVRMTRIDIVSDIPRTVRVATERVTVVRTIDA